MDKSDLLRKAAGILSADGHTTLALNILGLDKKTECGIAEWNGTGLPPVGCECEYKEGGQWARIKVIGRYKDRFWLLVVDHDRVINLMTRSAVCFRPIRAGAEKQREADRGALRAMMINKVGFWTPGEMIEAILDAGFTRGGDKKKAP